MFPDGRTDSHSTEDMSQGLESSNLEVMGQNVMYTASDTGLSLRGGTGSRDQPRSRSGSKLTSNSMKKSITTGVSSFSNFMGKIKNKLDPEDYNDDCDRYCQTLDEILAVLISKISVTDSFQMIT